LPSAIGLTQHVYEALGSLNLMKHPRQLRAFEVRENGQLDIASNELMILPRLITGGYFFVKAPRADPSWAKLVRKSAGSGDRFDGVAWIVRQESAALMVCGAWISMAR
jgi:hypothetical protein